tara:strand:+ start:7853 stop:8377 length:525 start_codon:yes stop_codon:yes gene_type:complete
VAPPLNIIIINSNKNEEFNDKHRRLIAKIAPICMAYNFHLTLVNFQINSSALDFAKEIAPATSIGSGGEKLITLAEEGRLQITNLPIANNFGEIIICTSKPEQKKITNIKTISNLSKENKISLIFVIDDKRNKNINKLLENSKYHCDISNNNIKLELDTEIGAITSIVHKIRTT